MMKLVITLFCTFCIWNYSFSNTTETAELSSSLDNDPIDVMGTYEEKPELNNKKQVDLEKTEEIIIDTKIVRSKPVLKTYAPAPKKVITRADRLKAARIKLELRNEQLVKKQIEEMRLRQELAMMKRIEQAFETSMDKLDSLQ